MNHHGESAITKGSHNLDVSRRDQERFAHLGGGRFATTPQRWVHKHIQKKRARAWGRATVRAALGFLIGHEADKRGIDFEEFS